MKRFVWMCILLLGLVNNWVTIFIDLLLILFAFYWTLSVFGSTHLPENDFCEKIIDLFGKLGKMILLISTKYLWLWFIFNFLIRILFLCIWYLGWFFYNFYLDWWLLGFLLLSSWSLLFFFFGFSCRCALLTWFYFNLFNRWLFFNSLGFLAFMMFPYELE